MSGGGWRFSHYVVSDSCNPMDCTPPSSSVHGISQARNTGLCCRFHPQGIFLTQGSNPHLLHWQADSLPLVRLGSSIFKGLKCFTNTSREIHILSLGPHEAKPILYLGCWMKHKCLISICWMCEWMNKNTHTTKSGHGSVDPLFPKPKYHLRPRPSDFIL